MAAKVDAAGIPVAPCFKCERRNAECHSFCSDYADFKEALDKVRSEERSVKMAMELAYNPKTNRRKK